MPFTYHPPTRTFCPICENLEKEIHIPVIESMNGKASQANSFPIHNWYHFVLGYSPEFPDYVLSKFAQKKDILVVDPFMGAATTLVCCKFKGIRSSGIDANDYFADVAQVKLDWSFDISVLVDERDKLISLISDAFNNFDFGNNKQDQLSFNINTNQISLTDYVAHNRPAMLEARYISDRPFAKAHIIKEAINKRITNTSIKKLFNLALASILVPISNVKYGPGFGVTKPKYDVNVLGYFKDKVDRMISDLRKLPSDRESIPSEALLGDSRELSNYYVHDSVDIMITSPPYPGDHEYTKHTRLELLFMKYANDLATLRKIKQRMIRGSTTNIYSSDNDADFIKDVESIQGITALIEERLQKDGATSGFEKLYTKLVREYFGGMYRVLAQALEVLKIGGKFSLLVSDSHAFKMVHISTAAILAEIGIKAGYNSYTIELWQDKISTSHNYNMRENILTLTK